MTRLEVDARLGMFVHAILDSESMVIAPRSADHHVVGHLRCRGFLRRGEGAMNGSQEPEPLLQFFRWAHLPVALQGVSRLFGRLAAQLVVTLPRCPERTVALRKLLEAKDCAVRAALPVEPIGPEDLDA